MLNWLKGTARKEEVKSPAAPGASGLAATAAPNERLQAAQARHDVGAYVESHRLCRSLLDDLSAGKVSPAPPGLQLLVAKNLNHIGHHEAALRALALHLQEAPGDGEARVMHDRLEEALRIPAPQPRLEADGTRSYHTSLDEGNMRSIQQACHNYSYRGVPMTKNPFDLAIYPLLIWRLQPKTIFEIGSKNGGSGLWFGDMVTAYNLPTKIHSIDVIRPDDVSHPRVNFIEGDGRRLELTLTPEFLRDCPRPWLVIEDADHAYETTLAVLKTFHPLLQAGDYIVVEDGIISDLMSDPNCNIGPHRGLREFLATNGAAYEMDATYCDFWGYNVTWCTNGFLRRK